MKNMRLYRKNQKGDFYIAWQMVLGNDEMLAVDNMLEPDGPDFVIQVDSHLIYIMGAPTLTEGEKRLIPL